MEALFTRELVKTFGSFRALDELDLEVEKGDLLCLLGPNGAGKSTLIRVFTGLLKPDSGTVRVAGMELNKNLEKIRSKVGLVPERVILYDALTPVENLLFFASMNGMNSKLAEEKILELLQRVDMLAWKDRPVRTFSTGMRQRINFIRALTHEPEIVFMDEPTLGLDPQTTHAIRKMIKELNETGTTVVVTTHMMGEAEKLAKHVGIMHRGRIVAFGELERLRKLPNRDRLRLKLPTTPEIELSDLEGFICQRKSNGYLLVELEYGTSIEKIVAALAAKKLELLEIEHVRPSLEEVFIELTVEKTSDSDQTPWSDGFA